MSSADPGRLGLGDVDDHDIGELLVRDRPGHRGADVARAANNCDFSIHRSCLIT